MIGVEKYVGLEILKLISPPFVFKKSQPKRHQYGISSRNRFRGRTYELYNQDPYLYLTYYPSPSRGMKLERVSGNRDSSHSATPALKTARGRTSKLLAIQHGNGLEWTYREPGVKNVLIAFQGKCLSFELFLSLRLSLLRRPCGYPQRLISLSLRLAGEDHSIRRSLMTPPDLSRKAPKNVQQVDSSFKQM